MPRTVEAFAPAKINLTLHVTGQRADGYHLLDSLVVFADVGDRVIWAPAAHTVLTPVGPYAASVPHDGSNLVLKAKQVFAPDDPAEIMLEKNLPPASGIGGGSSDAAATLRAMAQGLNRELPDPEDCACIGADVPVCLSARPTRMRGVGERLDPLAGLPPLYLVLVNPGVAVATRDIFAQLAQKSNAPMPEILPEWPDVGEFARWLARQRNDLELPARALTPAIGVALARMQHTSGCLLARMSGSGATCFGLYASRTEAEFAATSIADQHGGWWVVPASTWSNPGQA